MREASKLRAVKSTKNSENNCMKREELLRRQPLVLSCSQQPGTPIESLYLCETLVRRMPSRLVPAPASGHFSFHTIGVGRAALLLLTFAPVLLALLQHQPLRFHRLLRSTKAWRPWNILRICFTEPEFSRGDRCQQLGALACCFSRFGSRGGGGIFGFGDCQFLGRSLFVNKCESFETHCLFTPRSRFDNVDLVEHRHHVKIFA